MRQSKLFTKTRREAPSDEVSKNASLLIRAGFIYKEMAGVYAFLPLGLRVMNHIERIVREEMNKVGGQEIKLTALQSKELWQKTDRWSDEVVDNWFKTKLKNDTEVGLAFTHEEPLTQLAKDYVQSYKDLPFLAYQFQTKFRNESRAKSGILRGREFLMKDLYTFARSNEEHEVLYESLKDAYLKVFKRVGIGEKTFVTFASGGVFAKYSHEFQTETDAGEDIAFYSKDKDIAINKEVYTDEVITSLGLSKDELIEKKTVEVGNIFSLGTRFSDALDLKFKDENGEMKSVVMGSYGIGIGRLMGTIVEVLGTSEKMVWPIGVAPYGVHIIDLSGDDEILKSEVEALYKKIGKEYALIDDRDMRAGEKFGDADLIGIPIRIIGSKKSFEKGGFEVMNLITGEMTYQTKEEIAKQYGN